MRTASPTLTREDGSTLSRSYLEAIRSDARREADAMMLDRPTTLSAAFSAYRDEDD